MATTTVTEEINNAMVLTDRVKRRREEYLAATPHLCAERSRLVTQSWKETEGEALDIRRARLFKKVMEGISVVIREGELIVGSQTKYIRGAGPCVDWSSGHVSELFETDHLTLSGLVETAEVTEAEKASLLEDFHYWKGRSPRDAIITVQREVLGDKIYDLSRARFNYRPETEAVSPRVQDHERVLNKGLNGIIAEAKEKLQELSFSEKDDIDKYHFLQGVIIACKGAIKFAHRYAELARELAGREGDTVRKKELEKIADICQWVPAKPARSFYEALQSVWFTHLSANLEISKSNELPGRMDQFLYPFYKRDLETGQLTRQQAAELLGCLWVKFAEMENVKSGGFKESSQNNQGQNVVIGGVTKDGTDATNELTYLLLEVTRQLKTTQPPLYVRCHSGTPEELWMKAVDVNKDRGDGNPAFLNDQTVLLNLAQNGTPIQDARDYAAGGCVQPLSHTWYHDKSILINQAKIFELTLNNGVDPGTGKHLGLATGDPRDFSSFDEFYDAYKKQVDFFVDLFAKSYRLFWQTRNKYYSTPFNSALVNDCISKGMDMAKGGTRYPHLYWGLRDRGHQNVADSLAAIKKLVFEEKKITMERLLEALKANFEGNGNKEIQRMLLAAPKYGNDDDYVDEIHDDLSLWQQRRIGREKHCLGHNMPTGRGGAAVHSFLGKTVGALPDGRKAWEPLADGSLSPMRGVDIKGPTAVVNSASRINHLETARYSLFNMKFSPAAVRSRESMRKLIALTKTYFDRGGYHIQFNMMGQEILLKAQKHPEQYRDLLVRVAGYSAYFVDLSTEVQNDIIARTEHAL